MSRFFHTGEMNIDGETIFVKVQYGTPVYPVMQLTWGYGAAPGIVGFFEDHLEGNPTATPGIRPAPRIVQSMVVDIKDEATAELFPVTFAEVTSEKAYDFEQSEDLIHWQAAPSVYLTNTPMNQIWGIIHQPGSSKQFVRFKTVE
jgi:hypothetical protein